MGGGKAGPGPERLPLGAVARIEGVAHSTACRWASRGILTPRGRVFLATVRVGGTCYTTRADLDVFRARLNRKAVAT